MLQWLKKLPTLKLVIYILFIVHLLLSGFSVFDGLAQLSGDWMSWYPFIVVLYTIVWGFCLRDSKKAYYIYLFLCFFQVLAIVYAMRANIEMQLIKTFFPLNLFFAFILLFDIKRLMGNARTR
jgi:hypothetical protein